MNKYLTESIGTFFLVLTIGCTVIGRDPHVVAPLAIGAVLMVMIYAGGHISGAHYNPAVTLAVWMRGRIEMKDAIMYWIAQVAGAVVAALLVTYLFDKGAATDCADLPSTNIKAIVAELLGTFALAYVVLNV